MSSFSLDDREFEISEEDVVKAFKRTEEGYNEFGHQPYHYIIIGEEKKPVKEVFRNIESVPEDLTFTSHDAEDIFSQIGFELFDERNDAAEVVKNTLLEIIENYTSAQKDEFSGDHRMYKLIRERLPNKLKLFNFYNKSRFTTLGSPGKGNWSNRPFAAVLADEETTTPREGVYVDYLFKPGEGKIYLALDQGFTKIREEKNKRAAVEHLKKRAKKIRQNIGLEGFKTEYPSEDDLDRNARVYFKEYDINDFPTEREIEKDLEKVLKAYEKYLDMEEQKERKNTPQLFLAPCSNDDAYAHLRDTVIRRVPTDKVWKFSPERDFEHDVVSVWGNREGTSSSWRKIDEGDFLLFYRNGKYIYGAEIIDTETNADLAKELWPDDGGDPWKHIIYLKEPFRLDISQDEINDLAGYAENNVCQGFQSYRDEGIKSIQEKYGSVREFLSEKKTGTASPETDFIDYNDRNSQVQSSGLQEHQSGLDYEGLEVSEDLNVELDSSVLDELYFQDDEGEDIIRQVQGALNSGKHIIFTGPPGTGKTELAEIVAEEMEKDSNITGHQLATATSDWSTFDTVGGFMPEKNGGGDLEFNPGQVLKRFKDKKKDQKNELLVIDEINRADIDKAFGQFFTVLSGQRVQLPFTKGDEEKEIEVLSGDHEKASNSPEEHQYVIPESWRIMATMNTYDKTSLYEMSYAFMRRFSFIRIEAPEIPDEQDERKRLMEGYLDAWEVDMSAEDEEVLNTVEIWKQVNSADVEREIGPAIAKDILEFLSEAGTDEKSNTAAITNYIFPQLEGVPERKQIVESISKADVELDEDRLERTARNMLQVDISGEE